MNFEMKKQTTFASVSLDHWKVALLLLAFFLYRLGYGLCSEFWYGEEKQVYLIGLNYYATGQWPYFGATAYQAEIPGALQGLVIAIPLFLWPVPEAPFIFLNLLSFGALCLFAWYCSKHLPDIPRWFIWTWLLTAPWTLNYSTHIINPSYVLFGAILFFIGFLETWPDLSLNLFPTNVCNLLMGFSFFWIIQFHLSGAVLLPLIGLSFYFQWKASPSRCLKSSPWFLAGSVVSGIFILPTFLKYGLSQGSGQTSTLLQLHPDNIKSLFTVLARVLSFASFELPRFVGANTAERWAFFKSHFWLIPLGAFLLLAGWLQVLFLVVQWVLRKSSEKDWQAIKSLILGSILLIYVSFWFTSKTPAAHTYYLFLPAAMLYSFYCWNDWVREKQWQKWAKIFLVCGLLYQASLALAWMPIRSMYKDRSIPASAITQKNYHLLGEKHSDSW
jgi:hypothetical protein